MWYCFWISWPTSISPYLSQMLKMIPICFCKMIPVLEKWYLFKKQESHFKLTGNVNFYAFCLRKGHNLSWSRNSKRSITCQKIGITFHKQVSPFNTRVSRFKNRYHISKRSVMLKEGCHFSPQLMALKKSAKMYSYHNKSSTLNKQFIYCRAERKQYFLYFNI